jgi:hypothetical protein
MRDRKSGLGIGAARPRAWNSIRIASTPDELEAVLRFRQGMLIRHSYQDRHVSRPLKERIDQALDATALYIAAFSGLTVVATARINQLRDSPPEYIRTLCNGITANKGDAALDASVVTQLLVHPALQRTTLGLRVCLKCYEIGITDKTRYCFIDCDEHRLDFHRDRARRHRPFGMRAAPSRSDTVDTHTLYR